MICRNLFNGLRQRVAKNSRSQGDVNKVLLVEVDQVWFDVLVVAVDQEPGQVEPTVNVVGRGDDSLLASSVCQDTSSHPDTVRPSPAVVLFQKSILQQSAIISLSHILDIEQERKSKDPKPSNLVVWPLVLFPMGVVLLLVVLLDRTGLHHGAHLVVLVLQVELVPEIHRVDKSV